MPSPSQRFHYSIGDLVQLIQDEPEKLSELFALFSTRYIHIKQLGIERNTYLNWEKGGLIPYDREEKGWRKFSFLESVWIKTIVEMRALGVSTETIRLVKTELWAGNQEAFYEVMIEGLRQSTVDVPGKDDILKQINEEGTEGIKRGLRAIQLSPMMFIVVASLLRKITYLLSINKHQEITLIPLISHASGMDESVQRLQAELFTTSSTIINLWAIIQELGLSNSVQLNEEVVMELVTPSEKKILELIKDKGYREIIITKGDDGVPTHIKLKKEGVTQEVVKRLLPYLKKGAYKTIEFKTRDGQLVHYEETEVIKLNIESKKKGKTKAHKATQTLHKT